MFSLKIDLDQSQAVLTRGKRDSNYSFICLIRRDQAQSVASLGYLLTQPGDSSHHGLPVNFKLTSATPTSTHQQRRPRQIPTRRGKHEYISCFHSNLYYKMTSNVLAKIDARNQMTSRRSSSAHSRVTKRTSEIARRRNSAKPNIMKAKPLSHAARSHFARGLRTLISSFT
jgi:hypothetical protein